ncbi:response regulator transcription factor [Tropicimonas aquimaris]|uniref:Response regulator transcription factor n=1 Tax=Tropicimonas aquimaris TaxID=914152 RepID=A0ABW3IT36_9RHOB
MPDVANAVFIVDDDQDIRTSLSRALRKRGFEVQTFGSAREFLYAYDNEQVGCLVLDYGMPEMSGLELQQRLNEAAAPLELVFITGHGGVPESVQAIKSGAVNFLEKPFRQSDLVKNIQTALSLAGEKQARLQNHRQISERFERLTAREKEIVAHMIARPAEVSSKEIANHLGISPRTVDHHRARILEKLEVNSVVELIDLASRLKDSI